MLQGLLKKLQNIQLPDTTIKAMYNLIAQGNGERRTIRLQSGIFAEKTQTGEYVEITDIFTYVITMIPNAPEFIVKQAKKMMHNEGGQMTAAINQFCGNGGSALIVFQPDPDGLAPQIAGIIKVGETVTRYDNDAVFELFKRMIAQR